MGSLQNTSQVKETRETETRTSVHVDDHVDHPLFSPFPRFKGWMLCKTISLPLRFNSNPSMTSNEGKVQGALDNHNQDVVFQNAKYVVLHPETQLHSKDAANKFNHQTRTLITDIFLPRKKQEREFFFFTRNQ